MKYTVEEIEAMRAAAMKWNEGYADQVERAEGIMDTVLDENNAFNWVFAELLLAEYV